MYSKIFSGFRVKLDKQSQTGTLKSREWKSRHQNMQGWKSPEWKSRHQNARLEIAGVEIAAPECKAGNRRSGNRGRRKKMESDSFKNVFLTILTENRVIIRYDKRQTDIKEKQERNKQTNARQNITSLAEVNVGISAVITV